MFEFEIYVAWTVEVHNAAEDIEMEVCKNQTEAILSYVTSDKIMRQ